MQKSVWYSVNVLTGDSKIIADIPSVTDTLNPNPHVPRKCIANWLGFVLSPISRWSYQKYYILYFVI